MRSAMIFMLLALVVSVSAPAQTMPKKFDQQCLDSCGESFIRCNAGCGPGLAGAACYEQCKSTKASCEKSCRTSNEPATPRAPAKN